MLHTYDDFLSAIAAQPADRTLRLVFADWLDEHDYPTGALVRIEEEMRQLPVYSDRFWELKPRRNELRTRAGTKWCEEMYYGTECEPVFRHGIPDGWRERWRLIREFTERWYRVPMPDTGGQQDEIARAEAQSKVKLSPSMREWIALVRDAQRNQSFGGPFWSGFQDHRVPDQRAVALANLGDVYYGVRDANLIHPDPPVHRYVATGAEWANDDYQPTDFVPDGDQPAIPSVTEFALRHVTITSSDHWSYPVRGKQAEDGRRAVEGNLPLTARYGGLEVYEADNILIAFGEEPDWGGEDAGLAMWVKMTTHLAVETLPAGFREFIAQRIKEREREDSEIPF
jgi:uncharacterized protein (TIGR02996 family)